MTAGSKSAASNSSTRVISISPTRQRYVGALVIITVCSPLVLWFDIASRRRLLRWPRPRNIGARVPLWSLEHLHNHTILILRECYLKNTEPVSQVSWVEPQGLLDCCATRSESQAMRLHALCERCSL